MFSWFRAKPSEAPLHSHRLTSSAASHKKLFSAFNAALDQPGIAPENIDMLAIVENNLESLMTELNTELKKWENIQINLTRNQRDLHTDLHELKKKFSLLAVIKHVLLEIEELCESPDEYLEHLIQRVEPEVDKIRAKINEIIKSDLPEAQKQLQVSHFAMDLITALQSINNKLQSEISYCLDFEKFSEDARDKLLKLTVLTATGVIFDFNDPNSLMRYRKRLYGAIEGQLTHIDKIMTDARGDLEKGKHYIEDHVIVAEAKDKALTKPRNFWTPDRNIREAADKLEEQTTLHRSNSVPSFRSR